MKKTICLLCLGSIFFAKGKLHDSSIALDQKSFCNEIFDKKKYDGSKITLTLFMYGAQSYVVDENGNIKFNVSGDYKINKETGNINDYKLNVSDKKIFSNNGYSISILNDQLILVTRNGQVQINEKTDIKKLDKTSRFLLFMYSELFGNAPKLTYDEHLNKMAAGGSCRWSNTYYISGWGWNSNAAWADYHDSVANYYGLPDGGNCSPLGNPTLETYDIPGLGIHYYQVMKAWCCG